jgi:enoyl-CoA hydratase/carnithine racemase
MIDLAYKGHVAILKMHHGKANAMDAALCDGIMKRLEQLRTSDAQAVVLTAYSQKIKTVGKAGSYPIPA